jgi:hypothetical protein
MIFPENTVIPRPLVLLSLASLLSAGLAVNHFVSRSTIAAEREQQDPLSDVSGFGKASRTAG